jgi:hypothetical protein
LQLVAEQAHAKTVGGIELEGGERIEGEAQGSQPEQQVAQALLQLEREDARDPNCSDTIPEKQGEEYH